MPPWLPHVLTLVGVVVVAGGGLLGSVLVARNSRRTALQVARKEAASAKQIAQVQATSAHAEVQEAINAGFHEMLEAWKTERGVMEAQLAEATALITGLKGEVRHLIQHVESLEKVLRDQGLKIPRRPRKGVRPALSVVAN